MGKMAKIKFTFRDGDYVLQFTYNNQFPVSRTLEKQQAIDRAADGSLQVEDLGTGINRRELVFQFMPQADYDALRTWFDLIANGSENSFTFTDERENDLTVKIISRELDFVEDDWGQYSGAIMLEVVS